MVRDAAVKFLSCDHSIPAVHTQPIQALVDGLSSSASSFPNMTTGTVKQLISLLALAAEEIDNATEELKPNEAWHRLKLHAVKLNRYYHSENDINVPEEGLARLKEETGRENG